MRITPNGHGCLPSFAAMVDYLLFPGHRIPAEVLRRLPARPPRPDFFEPARPPQAKRRRPSPDAPDHLLRDSPASDATVPSLGQYDAVSERFRRGAVCRGLLTTRGAEVPARCLDPGSVRPGAEAGHVEARLRTGRWHRFAFDGPPAAAVGALQCVIAVEAGAPLPCTH